MPIWLSLLEWAVKALIWLYGHKAVVAKVTKYTPIQKEENPPLSQQNNPNVRDHFGGL